MKLIIFDTNVLLDLYMLSKENSESIIDFFKTNGELYISEVVYEEFKKNYQAVRSQRGNRNLISLFEKQYLDVKKVMKKSIDKLTNNTTYKAFETKITELTSKFESDSMEYFFKLEGEINELKSTYDYDYKNDDPVYNFVEYIIDKKSYTKYTQKEKIKMAINAEQRIKLEIKPGLTDTCKNSSAYSKYGDIFIWFDLLNISSNYNEVVFLQNEKKNDWWEDNGYRPAESLLTDWSDEYGKTKTFEMLSLENYLIEYQDLIDTEALVQYKKLKEQLSIGINNLLTDDEIIIEKVMDLYFDIDRFLLGSECEGGNISDIYNVEMNYDKNATIDVDKSDIYYNSICQMVEIDTFCTMYYSGDIDVEFDKDSFAKSYRVDMEITFPIFVSYQIIITDEIDFEISEVKVESNKIKVSYDVINTFEEDYEPDYDFS